MPFRTAIALALLAIVGAAQAQLQRSFPDDVRQARMVYVGERTVILNGYAAELTVGAQIRDQQNLIILPSSLPTQSLVRYQEDAEGRVHRVWILRDDEIAQPPPSRKMYSQ